MTIAVRNGVNQTQNNIQLYYQLNNGAIINETINSIGGKKTINYSFKETLDLSKPGSYIINVWLVASGDSYTKNDSILNYETRTQPKISSFPYFQNFEENDGFWYTKGVKSTWEYGVPNAKKISSAASGTKAWVTKLNGNYNSNELSYLISPCFDVSRLYNPTLRFKDSS